jgi:hypothetical protein
MVQNLSPQELYGAIVNDFECAWNSLAANPMATGRGNFMFARQAMTLLEFAARLCMSDPQRVNGQPVATREFAEQLALIEPKYFTQLPGPCADFRDFILPFYPLTRTNPQSQLLWAVFDLIRNGQAHQYQQIIVDLTDKTDWAISLTGATSGRYVGAARPPDHLGYRRDENGDIWVLVYPDVMFVDAKTAILASGILSQHLSFQYLRRPKAGTGPTRKTLSGPFYEFTSSDLESSLASAGHPRLS